MDRYPKHEIYKVLGGISLGLVIGGFTNFSTMECVRRFFNKATRVIVNAIKSSVLRQTNVLFADDSEREEVSNIIEEKVSPEILAKLRTARLDTPIYKARDGATAAAYVAYMLSDSAFIFPITPSTPLGEQCDMWKAEGKLNAFGQTIVIKQMQSEAGAAGAVHGSLVVGGFSTTFTASQGLLLMIPNMYKIAGELLPCVFHVPSRSVAGQALSIFGDHSDIMAARVTGFALLCANNVQECLDIALVAHIATLKSRIPFIHFFDGFRTSHEIQKIEMMTDDQMKVVVDCLSNEIEDHHRRALNPSNPTVRGTAQSQDIYFQNMEAANTFYKKLPGHVVAAFQMVKELTGREYRLFEYYGDPSATDVVVVMGAALAVVREVVSIATDMGKIATNNSMYKRIGVIGVRLFRPLSMDHFLQALPKSVKRITVLDHCKEVVARREPLCVDVSEMIHSSSRKNIMVIGGRFGLASKTFTPGMAMAVFKNMHENTPQDPFTIGIHDDVTNLSLLFSSVPSYYPAEIYDQDPTKQAMFWGFGSDGTVGASKNATKIIAENTSLCSQGFFAYDALKAGGVTISHLRYGPIAVDRPYEIVDGCHYVAIHKTDYVRTISSSLTLGPCGVEGILVINCPWKTIAELDENMPDSYRRLIYDRKLRLYVIDAAKVAFDSGMGSLINNIMQSVFFRLGMEGIEELSFEKALFLFRNAIEKTYRNKGRSVVERNLVAVDNTLNNLQSITAPEHWKFCEPGPGSALQTPLSSRTPELWSAGFVESVLKPIHAKLGDLIPVSAFEPGGQVPLGHTQWAKRGVAKSIPVVDMNACTQCNKCSAICPHAVIRPFLVTPSELTASPDGFISKPATGGNAFSGLAFRIQASPLDCTGCEVCVHACPDNALKMTPIDDAKAMGETEKWDFAINLPSRGHRFDPFTLKGSQFQQPLLEFSGACEGCGETPYAKLLTQMFGKNLVIANATGCSSIWGATAGWIPYTVDKKTGRGVAWGNSLFEDNAEYGLGMASTIQHRRNRLVDSVESLLAASPEVTKLGGDARGNLGEWLKNRDSYEGSEKYGLAAISLLEEMGHPHPIIIRVLQMKDLFIKISRWVMGGDGWANDIGFGGIDHLLGTEEPINILILDTEVYSNTGGQGSKATPAGSVAKFMSSGRVAQKKDMGEIAMRYPNVYVAYCSMGADYTQSVKALKEADDHDGPSVVICYAPCIEHRTKSGLSKMANDERDAVLCGYWPLYRFDPKLANKGENPFILDCKTIDMSRLDDFLANQNRYAQLLRDLPNHGAKLRKQLKIYLMTRFEELKYRSLHYTNVNEQEKEGVCNEDSTTTASTNNDDPDCDPSVAQRNSKLPVVSGSLSAHILYGSETGITEQVAQNLFSRLRRRGILVRLCSTLNEVGIDESLSYSDDIIIFMCSTCGHGDIPSNASNFFVDLASRSERLTETQRFVVLGMGDLSYEKFCESAVILHNSLADLGFVSVLPLCMADDRDPDGYETKYAPWEAALCELLGALPAHEEAYEPLYRVQECGSWDLEVYSQSYKDISSVVTATHIEYADLPHTRIIPPGASLVRVMDIYRLTRDSYFRTTLHVALDTRDADLPFCLGDALTLYPRNLPEYVYQLFEAGAIFDNLDPHGLFTIDLLSDNVPKRVKDLTRQTLQIKQILIDLIDIFGNPSKSFYAKLSKLAPDNEKLNNIVETSSKSDSEHTKTLYTYADVIAMAPELKLSVIQIFELIPLIKPRLYSIANSAFLHPGKIELTVIVNVFGPEGNLKTGLSTSYIRSLVPGSFVNASIATGTFVFPENNNAPSGLLTPMVLTGLGTGIAPMRAFVQDRLHKRRNGFSTGPIIVFYGCRHESEEYYYKDEWASYKESGVLTEIIPVFSHDNTDGKLTFVQDRMAEPKFQKMVRKLLLEDGGYFYFCGLAIATADIDKAVIKSVVDFNGQVGDVSGIKWLDEFKNIHHRYSVESY